MVVIEYPARFECSSHHQTRFGWLGSIAIRFNPVRGLGKGNFFFHLAARSFPLLAPTNFNERERVWIFIFRHAWTNTLLVQGASDPRDSPLHYCEMPHFP
jgi:hypothetical protein